MGNKAHSKELAFFSMLETTMNLNLVEEKANFKIQLAELVEKLEMNLEAILQHVRKLEKMGILKIRQVDAEFIILDLSSARTKVLEVFSMDEIDNLLQEFDLFIKKYDGLSISNDKMKIYTNKIKERLDKCAGSNVYDIDINDIIKDGISDVFDDKEIIKIEKKMYNLCEMVNETELSIVEVILFCLYNFKKEDNPFFVTLFLSSVYFTKI